MSATLCHIHWGVLIEDHDHWSQEHKEEVAEANAEGYADWVLDKLTEAMEKAGNKFIKNNPDLFRVKELC